MQSKKNKFCMQYCKPRYLSTTDKKVQEISLKNEYFIDNSLVVSFANRTVSVSLFVGYIYATVFRYAARECANGILCLL